MIRAVQRIVQLAALFALILIATISGFNLLSQRSVVKAFQPASPFTLNQRQTSVNTSTNIENLMEQRVIAVSSKGSRVRRVHDLHLNTDSREISNSNGIMQETREEAKVISTVKLSTAELVQKGGTLQDPAKGCAVQRNGLLTRGTQQILGDDLVLGIAVKKIRYSYPDGSSLTTYYAPSLGCESLRENYVSPHGWNAFLYTDKVDFSEPDPGLFGVNDSYSEVIYSEAMRKHLDLTGNLGVPFDSSLSTSLSNRDHYYLTHRP